MVASVGGVGASRGVVGTVWVLASGSGSSKRRRFDPVASEGIGQAIDVVSVAEPRDVASLGALQGPDLI